MCGIVWNHLVFEVIEQPLWNMRCCRPIFFFFAYTSQLICSQHLLTLNEFVIGICICRNVNMSNFFFVCCRREQTNEVRHKIRFELNKSMATNDKNIQLILCFALPSRVSRARSGFRSFWLYFDPMICRNSRHTKTKPKINAMFAYNHNHHTVAWAVIGMDTH